MKKISLLMLVLVAVLVGCGRQNSASSEKSSSSASQQKIKVKTKTYRLPKNSVGNTAKAVVSYEKDKVTMIDMTVFKDYDDTFSKDDAKQMLAKLKDLFVDLTGTKVTSNSDGKTFEYAISIDATKVDWEELSKISSFYDFAPENKEYWTVEAFGKLLEKHDFVEEK